MFLMLGARVAPAEISKARGCDSDLSKTTEQGEKQSCTEDFLQLALSGDLTFAKTTTRKLPSWETHSRKSGLLTCKVRRMLALETLQSQKNPLPISHGSIHSRKDFVPTY